MQSRLVNQATRLLKQVSVARGSEGGCDSKSSECVHV